MFTKENTESIVFSDQEQRYVSIYYNDDEVIDPERGFHLRRADYDLEDSKNPDVQQLLKLWTFEEIEVHTREFKKQERLAYEAEVIDIAKREGLIVEDQNKEQEDPRMPLDDLIFNWNKEDEKQKELLFQLKLKMFDMKHVQESNKKTSKTSLRKAQTPLDALVAYSKF